MSVNMTAEQLVIHYGPVWYKRGMSEHFSFAACEIPPPNTMSTHKPWVNCEACKQTKDFGAPQGVQRAIGDCEHNGGHDFGPFPNPDGTPCRKGCGAVYQS